MSLKLHLQEIEYKPSRGNLSGFPFNLPILANLTRLPLKTPVTIMVGENGAGKSTLLEAIAAKINLQSLGEGSLENDPTLTHARLLASAFSMKWKVKMSRGFFLRAEDYFSYLKRVEQEREYYFTELKRVGEEFKDKSIFARNQAKMTFRGGIADIQTKFGENADGQSHGESFLNIFHQRIKGSGLFVIDEPEAALSPISQFALISLIIEGIQSGGQFLIATHSPILMAIPGATLLNCDESPPTEIEYDTIEHVVLYREFLRDPKNFIRRL